MDLNLITLLALGAALLVGAFLGVQLGRRSKTANIYADRIQEQLDRAEAKVHELEAKARKDS